MVANFPVIVSSMGAISSLALGLWLRKSTISENPAKSRAHLSREQKQKNITIARRVAYAMSAFWFVGAVLLAWLAN